MKSATDRSGARVAEKLPVVPRTAKEIDCFTMTWKVLMRAWFVPPVVLPILVVLLVAARAAYLHFSWVQS